MIDDIWINDTLVHFKNSVICYKLNYIVCIILVFKWSRSCVFSITKLKLWCGVVFDYDLNVKSVKNCIIVGNSKVKPFSLGVVSWSVLISQLSMNNLEFTNVELNVCHYHNINKQYCGTILCMVYTKTDYFFVWV